MKAILKNKTLHGDPAKTYVTTVNCNGILCLMVDKFFLSKEKLNILGLTLVKQYKGKYLYYGTFSFVLSTFFKIHDFVRNTLIENQKP
jgi:hypothetical protein